MCPQHTDFLMLPRRLERLRIVRGQLAACNGSLAGVLQVGVLGNATVHSAHACYPSCAFGLIGRVPEQLLRPAKGLQECLETAGERPRFQGGLSLCTCRTFSCSEAPAVIALAKRPYHHKGFADFMA